MRSPQISALTFAALSIWSASCAQQTTSTAAAEHPSELKTGLTIPSKRLAVLGGELVTASGRWRKIEGQDSVLQIPNVNDAYVRCAPQAGVCELFQSDHYTNLDSFHVPPTELRMREAETFKILLWSTERIWAKA
jgi:hypothetical protein